jgi:hypothetical protein
MGFSMHQQLANPALTPQTKAVPQPGQTTGKRSFSVLTKASPNASEFLADILTPSASLRHTPNAIRLCISPSAE